MRAFALVVLAVAGCGKKTEPVAVQNPPPAPADNRNTNFQPGAGTVQNVRNAAKRTVALNDMKTLGELVEFMHLQLGVMPDTAAIKASIGRDAPKILKQIEDGTIVLTGTKQHDGLWAYEVDADKVGGIGLVAGRPDRFTAEQIQAMLGK